MMTAPETVEMKNIHVVNSRGAATTQVLIARKIYEYAIHTTVGQTESLLCGRPVAKPLEVVATAKGEGTVAI